MVNNPNTPDYWNKFHRLAIDFRDLSFGLWAHSPTSLPSN